MAAFSSRFLIVKSILDYWGAARYDQGMHGAVTADDVFFALGDASRRAIVDRLSRGPASVSSLAEPLDVTLAAVVQHVQVLERCGVVHSEKVGRVRTCQLASEGLATAERWIAQRRAQWEARFDRLGALLEAESKSESDKGKKT